VIFQLVYFLLVGWWLSLALITFGILLICTLILAPLGFAMVALGFKTMTVARGPV
jgi:uncharacterized membrane protein YccF (DUF307 family)